MSKLNLRLRERNVGEAKVEKTAETCLAASRKHVVAEESSE